MDLFSGTGRRATSGLQPYRICILGLGLGPSSSFLSLVYWWVVLVLAFVGCPLVWGFDQKKIKRLLEVQSGREASESAASAMRTQGGQ